MLTPAQFSVPLILQLSPKEVVYKAPASANRGDFIGTVWGLESRMHEPGARMQQVNT